ncbi:hypothetical protein GCM10009665_56300 [Kitasatospora nipponensis]|uniref:Acyl carrier protein n=1 Tax=Kitasatospora nipponensis TaxID=258049 RepID=A0ABN1WPN9_9ACTN
MTAQPPVTRQEVLEMLAAYGDRAPQAVDELVGSLELTWLISEAEQRYGREIRLSDERLDAVRTVDDVVRVLGEVLGESDSQADYPSEALRESSGSGAGAARP